MPILLGIDIGTSGTKTLLCNDKGDVLATATHPHTVDSPQPGWSEQDPAQWWSATVEATHAVLEKARISGDKVTGIGFSGQMHGAVLLDEKDAVLRPAILWNDQRTTDQCEEITRLAGGREALIQAVGNPALTGFTAPKVLWVRDHEPELYAKIKHLLLPKDYVRLLMTGRHATDVGDASGTLLLDVKNRTWNLALVETLGIDPAWLPECVESHEPVGALNEVAASELGLKIGTPVVAGSGDQPAGAIGSGIVDDGLISATLGTSGVVFAHAEQPIYDPQGRVHTMCSAVAGKWCVFGCMLSAAGSLQWFREALAPKVDFADLVQEAASAEPGSEGLFFLPYLTGERCPYPDPDARGAWIGLTPRHQRPHLVRALIEGVTFGMGDAVLILRDMGITADAVRVAGGGAQSELWRQLQADVYQAPVVTTNATQGPAYGAAILAGVGTGVWPDAVTACRACIKETGRLEPLPKRAEVYKKAHAQYTRLYAALKDEFASIASLTSSQ